jgi:hypothetical protein
MFRFYDFVEVFLRARSNIRLALWFAFRLASSRRSNSSKRRSIFLRRSTMLGPFGLLIGIISFRR